MAQSSIQPSLQCQKEKAEDAINSIRMMVEDVKQEMSKYTKSAELDTGLQMADHFSIQSSHSVLEKLMTPLREKADFHLLVMMMTMGIILMVLIAMMVMIMVMMKKLTTVVSMTHATRTNSYSKENDGGATASVAVIGPPQRAVFEKFFLVSVAGDTEPLRIDNVALLSSGIVLLTDYSNASIKVFHVKGRYFYSMKDEGRSRLTAVGPSTVAAVGTGRTLNIWRVNDRRIFVESSVSISKKYISICKCDDATLAAGFDGPPCGVDILDYKGKVVRSIDTEVPLLSICSVTHDTLLYSHNNNLFKVDIPNKRATRIQVPQIALPSGVAICQDGSPVVADRMDGSLHLLNREGQWVKFLWSQLQKHFRHEEDSMFVSVCESVCVCVTECGIIYILELQH